VQPARAAAPPRAPKPGKNAELIVRQGFLIDASKNGLHAVPEVVILANADGFQYLADIFSQLAEAARSRKKAAGDESIKMPRLEHPINARFSDDLDFRFAPLTAINRRAVLKQFGIDTKSKQTGSLFERYQEVLTHFSRLTNQMKRMGELTADRPPAAVV
jgi:hypothetical protein